MARLGDIAAFLDEALQIASIPDYPNALNGVQFANIGDIQRVATAVDFSTRTVTGAVEARAQLLVVHHGMFWGGLQPFTGIRHAQIRALATHDVAVYAAHLPLDVHVQYGNNALLARRFGLDPTAAFARFQTVDIGLSGETDIPTTTLVSLARSLAEEHNGAVVVSPFETSRRSRRWGICSGAGATSASLAEANRRGIDTLIVGEGPHHSAVEAGDYGIVVIYAGHYATETLGVRALGDALARRFEIESVFVAAPTGL
jgi:dinuclear metal center YbgI/SA1388 family protein